MHKILIGVMGPGERATADQVSTAYDLGFAIAQQGWIVVTGGRSAGVMDATCRGAKAAGGLTVGILPTAEAIEMSEAVDIPILTGMGSARNNINVLTSQVIVACGLGAGTVSEIALALKAEKPVVLMQVEPEARDFFQQLSTEPIVLAESVAIAIAEIHRLLPAN